MAELCRICNKTMLIGEAYKLENAEGTIFGYVHRTCLFPENPNKDGE